MQPTAARPFRFCWFCESIHPEDLIAVLAKGGYLLGCDWKYNWPHKFYVHGVIDPKDLNRELIGKWYNDHLRDLDDDTFFSMAKLLESYAGIKWIITPEDTLGFDAPYFGFKKQRPRNGH